MSKPDIGHSYILKCKFDNFDDTGLKDEFDKLFNKICGDELIRKNSLDQNYNFATCIEEDKIPKLIKI
jgi:hypothetical protein